MRLSILFPTYNRSAYLRRAVLSIASQVATIPQDFKISLYIFDNASSDGTQDACRELVSLHPKIQLIRHEENIGGDANINKALLHTKSDYVWIFGDDDYLIDGGLLKICTTLHSKRPAVLRLVGIEERGKKIDATSLTDTFIQKNKIYESADKILSQFGLGLGNFTKTIFSGAFIYKYYKPAGRVLFDSGYSQLTWLYSGLKLEYKELLEIPIPLVVIRIELSPRDIDPSKVKAGLMLLREHLTKEGYSLKTVSQFIKNQSDAIVLGELKAQKINGVRIRSSLSESWGSLSTKKSKAKLILFHLMPRQLMRKIWLARKS